MQEGRGQGELRQGQIYWALVTPNRGDRKARPVVIVTETQDIFFDREIVCVAITTSPLSISSPDLVALPWDPHGRAKSGLRRMSWAVCSWLIALKPSELLEQIGWLPDHKTAAILEKLRTPPERG